MAEFRISVDLRSIPAAGQYVMARALPLLRQAVTAVAQQTRANWMEAVQRAKLWSGEKDAYAGSIKWEMTGELEALVWTDYKYAEEIENGRPAKDLKTMLNTSLKVRTSKKGKRYLIIPMRHGTPGSNANPMPQGVYAIASQLSPSRIVGQGTRPSGTGAFDFKTRQPIQVPRNIYAWGGRLVGAAAAGGNKNHERMYRFDTTTPGGKRYSSYLTFRTMMEGSPGWIIGPRPGLHIVRTVVDEMKPLAEKAFEAAIERSLR
jgi:hypothetical protein